MSDPPQALTTLTEAQRALAMERFSLLRPALEEGVSQTEVAHLHHLPLRTVQRWISQYRRHGFADLARQERTNRVTRRGLEARLSIWLRDWLCRSRNAPLLPCTGK